MSLRTKIVLFNAFVLAFALLAAVMTVVGLWRAFVPLRQAITEQAQAVALAQEMRTQLAREATAFSVALATGGGDSEYRDANASFDRAIGQARTLAADGGARRALEAAYTAEAEFNQRAEHAMQQREEPGQALRFLAETVVPARDAADAALADFLERQEQAALAVQRRSEEDAFGSVALFGALLALAGASGGLFSLRFSRDLLERLNRLGSATASVAAGRRDLRIAAGARGGGGGDEIDQLGHSFDQMVVQLAEAEASAHRLDTLKSHFLAAASHDLRTPLTTVKGLLDTLRRDDASWDEETRREFIDLAAKECDRLTKLMTNMLDLSRIESGTWPLDRERVDVVALVRTRVEDLSMPGGALEHHHARVTSSGDEEAWADELQVSRVLENLLTNAAKFSPIGSPIEISVGTGPSAGAHDGEIVVHVQDSGPGVSPEDAERIFDKYYRTDVSHATAAGTGLGLAICRGIVEAHGGRIWVELASALGGASFAFTLPAARRAAGASEDRLSRWEKPREARVRETKEPPHPPPASGQPALPAGEGIADHHR